MVDKLLDRFGNLVKGTITGFDRLIFKGHLKPIIFAGGMQSLLYNKNILNKDYKNWMIKQTESIVEYTSDYLYKYCNSEIIPIKSSGIRKDELARKRREELNIKKGLIGVYSSVERCNSFKIQSNFDIGRPEIVHYDTKCKHLYFYLVHPVLGFMSVRLQTWMPYNVQIAVNGREWLKQLLKKENVKFVSDKNKFVDIEDFDKAQYLLNTQLDMQWKKILDDIINVVFPLLPSIVYNDVSYYWTLDQSEWAKDYIFNDSKDLNPIVDDLLNYSIITGNFSNIFRYMGHPIKNNGQPHQNFGGEIYARTKSFYNGVCGRFYLNKNSVKFYNFHNVFRIESTINIPGNFKISRHTFNSLPGEPKKLRSLRKGICDIVPRSKISDNCVNNFSNHLASFKQTTPIKDLISPVCKSFSRKSKKIRALDIFGKDLELLKSISKFSYNASFITNKELQKTLMDSSWSKGKTGKKLSSRISRNLKLLREHGLIKKYKNQRKYYLTDKGKDITSAIQIILSSSSKNLFDLAA
jgi:hypothetical protein